MLLLLLKEWKKRVSSFVRSFVLLSKTQDEMFFVGFMTVWTTHLKSEGVERSRICLDSQEIMNFSSCWERIQINISRICLDYTQDIWLFHLVGRILWGQRTTLLGLITQDSGKIHCWRRVGISTRSWTLIQCSLVCRITTRRLARREHGRNSTPTCLSSIWLRLRIVAIRPWRGILIQDSNS